MLRRLILSLAVAVAARHATADEIIRIMAANTTSGNAQSYDPGEGIRIFQGLGPDVVLIQEFNYQENSASDYRSFVDITFGDGFDYHVEPGGEQIPNGIISRYPILQSGEWDDTQVSNRDFAWAQIDIPGDRHLWAVSVHLLTDDSKRPAEATALRAFIENNVPANDYLVVGGDFNSDSFSDPALSTLSTVVDTTGRPADQQGTTGTNSSRAKPYDQVLPGPELNALETPVTLNGHGFSYSEGLVFDSRVFTPLTAVDPVLPGDSSATNMQHMAVVRDFLIPTATGNPEPTEYPTNFAGSPTPTTIRLDWTDVTSLPVPDGYHVRAGSEPPPAPPTDGVFEPDDSELGDGSATLNIPAGQEEVTFAGLAPETTYYFTIFPYTTSGPVDYRTGPTPPSVETTTLPDPGDFPDAPGLGPVYYPHASGFTATWNEVAGSDGYRIDVSESPTFSGGAGSLLIAENFDFGESVPSGWTDGGTARDSLASHYRSAANCRALGTGDTLETPPVDGPASLSFYADSSNGGAGNTAQISFSIGGGNWQHLGGFEVGTGGTVETIDLSVSPDLTTAAGVRFRFESGFNTWYLDDVTVTGAPGPGFVPGYNNLASGNSTYLDIAGLSPSTPYYFRVRAENASGAGPNSSTGTATTRPSGSPFDNWATDNGIAPVTTTSDFDRDGLTDIQEYAFATDPRTSGHGTGWPELDLSSGSYEISVRRSIAPGLTYTYLQSTDLIGFDTEITEGPGIGMYETLSKSRSGNYEEIRIRVNTGGVPRYFFRIKATANP